MQHRQQILDVGLPTDGGFGQIVAFVRQGSVDLFAELLMLGVELRHLRQHQMFGGFRFAEIDSDFRDHLFDLANRLIHDRCRGQTLGLVEQGVSAAGDDASNASCERVSHYSAPFSFRVAMSSAISRMSGR